MFFVSVLFIPHVPLFDNVQETIKVLSRFFCIYLRRAAPLPQRMCKTYLARDATLLYCAKGGNTYSSCRTTWNCIMWPTIKNTALSLLRPHSPPPLSRFVQILHEIRRRPTPPPPPRMCKIDLADEALLLYSTLLG